MSDGLERNARTVAVLTAVSRVTGLVRDGVFSRVLGTSEAMSAFGFAFLLPNLFRRLFGEGALSAAFLPTYQKMVEQDRTTAAALAGGLLGGLAVLLGLIVVVGESVLFLVSAMNDHENSAIWLAMITLPYMPLICLVAIVGAMLHVHGRFGPTAAAPILLNLCLIAAAVVGWSTFGTDDQRDRLLVTSVMASGVVVAGILQVAWSLWALRGRGGMTHDLARSAAPIKDIIRRAGPMVLGLGVLQLNTLFDGLIASWPVLVGDTIAGHAYPLDEHAMAVVSFAQRLYQFPLGVFGIAVATAIYPLLARRSDDDVAFAQTIRRGIRLVLFIGIPASIGLVIVRSPITAVVLQGRAFDADDTARVSFVLLGYATSVWAYALVQVLTRAFYARDDVMTPVRLAMGMVVLNLLLNVTLIWTPLREAGLAWSTALCAAIQACVLVWLLHRRGLEVMDSTVQRSIVCTVILSIMMAGVLVFIDGLMSQGEQWSRALARLIVLVVGGMAVYIGGAVALRMPEWAWAAGVSHGDRR